MNLATIAAVFIGGGLGSLCRYGISLTIIRTASAQLPWATIVANVLSCLVMAIALGYFADRISEGSWQRLFLLVGFCGGFSTFSTFSIENFQLMRDGHTGFLLANVLLSVVLCMLVFWVLAKQIR